jgi:hypothetical protein|tara:strand:- start:1267 stop:1545 length:279 start_codon:yes stop_codon:yes gene_type:complete
MEPVGALKLLFNLTIAPIPAAVKSSLRESSTQPMTLRVKLLVVAKVLIARRPRETPVVSVPVTPVDVLAFKNTLARAVALLVHVASVATTYN